MKNDWNGWLFSDIFPKYQFVQKSQHVWPIAESEWNSLYVIKKILLSKTWIIEIWKIASIRLSSRITDTGYPHIRWIYYPAHPYFTVLTFYPCFDKTLIMNKYFFRVTSSDKIADGVAGFEMLTVTHYAPYSLRKRIPKKNPATEVLNGRWAKKKIILRFLVKINVSDINRVFRRRNKKIIHWFILLPCLINFC